MNSVYTGGPAFPDKRRIYKSGYPTTEFEPVNGMTLRDYFAAKVIHGLLANPSGPIQANAMSGWGMVNCNDEMLAAMAYTIADAMLVAKDER